MEREEGRAWESVGGYRGRVGEICLLINLQEYGPVWQKDDVVGCGWDQMQHKIFFTLNGRCLGT